MDSGKIQAQGGLMAAKHFADSSSRRRTPQQTEVTGDSKRRKGLSALLRAFAIIGIIGFVGILVVGLTAGPKTVGLGDVIGKEEFRATQHYLSDGLTDCGYISMSGTVEDDEMYLSFVFEDGVNPIVEYRVHQIIHDEATATNIRGVLMDAVDTASSQDAVLSDGAVVRCEFSGPSSEHVATAIFTRAGLVESDDKEVALTFEDVWNVASADSGLRAELEEYFESVKAQVAETGFTDISAAVHGNELEFMWIYDENVGYVDSDSAYEALHNEETVAAMVNTISLAQQEFEESKLGITGITIKVGIQNNNGEVAGSCRYGIEGVLE